MHRILKRVLEGLILQKRGQITLFIIIGVVILLAVFGFLYIRGYFVERAVTEEIPTVTRIPLEFEPIRLYTQDCLKSIATEGVKILGEQGGYLYFDEFGINRGSSQPTEADAFEFAPESGLYVPYWWYLKAPNNCGGNCLFNSLRPPLHRMAANDRSVEGQLDTYIEKEILACIDNYNSFKLQGYSITPVGEIKSISRVTAYGISLYLEYPLNVGLGDKSAKITDYSSTINLNLNRMYELATYITNMQIKYKFLEKQMLDLITAYSGLDSNLLPPMADSTFSTSPSIIWIKTNVKQRIEEILMTYVSALQIYDTANFRKRYVSDRMQSLIYEAAELPIANVSREPKPFSDLSVTFDYLGWWPIYFNVNSQGEIIKGTSVINDLAEFFSLGGTRYKTVYDLSYPVSVEIRDPNAFNGAGYIFRFGLESNFRNNAPINEKFQGFEGATIFQPSLFCDYNQRSSGNISIKTVDAITGKPIPDVTIGFKCGEESCAMGVTNANGSLVTKFPLCFGGLLIMRHIDYFAPTNYFNTDYNISAELPTFRLYPFIEKKIRLSEFNTLPGTSTSIDKNERAIIRITRVKNLDGDPEHLTAADISGNSTEEHTLKLVPGSYEVAIDLLYMAAFTIPKDERKAGNWPFQKEYTIPAVTFDKGYMKGGVLFNNNTGYFVIKPEDLYGNNILNLFVYSSPLPTKIEKIYKVDTTTSVSTHFRNLLEPKFISSLINTTG